MGSWHRLLKSKHCYFLNITLPWMKIWGWRCGRYLHNHGFLLCKKCQCLRYTELIPQKCVLSFLEMYNCVWCLWTCPTVNFRVPWPDWPHPIVEHAHKKIWLTFNLCETVSKSKKSGYLTDLFWDMISWERFSPCIRNKFSL